MQRLGSTFLSVLAGDALSPSFKAPGAKPLRPALSAWRLPFRFRLMRAPGPGLSASSGPFLSGLR